MVTPISGAQPIRPRTISGPHLDRKPDRPRPHFSSYPVNRINSRFLRLYDKRECLKQAFYSIRGGKKNGYCDKSVGTRITMVVWSLLNAPCNYCCRTREHFCNLSPGDVSLKKKNPLAQRPTTTPGPRRSNVFHSAREPLKKQSLISKKNQKAESSSRRRKCQ